MSTVSDYMEKVAQAEALASEGRVDDAIALLDPEDGARRARYEAMRNDSQKES